MVRWVSLGLIGAAGCGGDKDTTTPSCSSVLISSFPEDGATDVYDRTVVDAVIGRAEDTATITVTDDAGTAVPGTVTHDDRLITFVPDAPFTPGGTYHSHLEWSCDPVDATFTVRSDIGAPVDGAVLADHTFVLDLRQGRYAYPVGMGDAMNQFLAANLLLAVDGVTGSDLQLSAGSASFDGAQDLCSATATYPSPADYASNPYFSIHLDALALEVVRDDFVMQDLDMSGSFAPDGESVVGLSIRGDLDCRSLVTELDVADAAAVCNVFSAGFGIDCTDCADGSGATCIPLVVDSLTLTRAGADLVPRTSAEIDADPACALE